MTSDSNPEGYPEDEREVKRTQDVVVRPCDQYLHLHKPHERSWNQSDPSGQQESFIRIEYCPGTARVI